jgi:hypothetical protein
MMAYIRNLKSGEKGYLLVLSVTAIWILLEPVLWYSYGYYGQPTALAFFDFIFRLSQFALFLVFVIALIVAAIRKQRFFAAILAIMAIIALHLLALMLPDSSAILYGMRYRIFRHHNLTEIRQFARDYDQLPKLSAPDVADFGKRYTYEDLAKAGLVAKYTFLSCLGRPTAYERENVVFVMDGDPLRGIYVTVDGTSINVLDYPSSEMLSVSDDIIFVTRFK